MTHEKSPRSLSRPTAFSSSGVLELCRDLRRHFPRERILLVGYPHGRGRRAQSCRNGASLRIRPVPGGPPAIKAFREARCLSARESEWTEPFGDRRQAFGNDGLVRWTGPPFNPSSMPAC